jgi:predicted transposase YdaD
LLVTWKISLEISGLVEQEEDAMVQLSQAYLEWEQRTEQRGIERGMERGIEQGERSLVLRLLTRKFGNLPDSLRSPIDQLSLSQLENLGEALLDFVTLTDLEAWLAQKSRDKGPGYSVGQKA